MGTAVEPSLSDGKIVLPQETTHFGFEVLADDVEIADITCCHSVKGALPCENRGCVRGAHPGGGAPR